MAIVPRSAPDVIAQSAMDEATAARSTGAGAPDLEAFDVGGGAKAVATSSAPLPVYTIPMEALAEERPSTMDDASQSGWRVLTADSRGSQLVDVSATTAKPLSVRKGRSVDMLTAAGQLAEDAAPPGTAYEPRILDFGRLSLSALWLHSQAAGDLLFRLDSKPAAVSPADFLAEASRRARRYIAHSTSAAARPGAPNDIGG
jgi:hypothetical protein